MTKVIRESYDAALERVNSDAWRVDAENGAIYDHHGRRFTSLAGNGYVRVYFRIATGRTAWVQAHRVIWESVHGPIPEGLTINHLNGNKTDNQIANLEAVTQSENNIHALRTGLRVARKGAEVPSAKLTSDQAVEIHRRAWEGEAVAVVASEFGVSETTVFNIKLGVQWNHATGHPAWAARRCRLTDHQALEIYPRAWAGEGQAALGAEFGVTRCTVADIKQGRTWAHATGHVRPAS